MNMNKTKSQQAQEYAEKKTNEQISENYGSMIMRRRVQKFDSYDIEQAFEDGYTAGEQSQWRSVEEKPQKNGDYLICTEYGEIEIAFWEDNYWLGNDSYPVRCATHWRELPTLPDTNTEKK